MCTADGRMFGSVAEALRMANATMDYLNGPEAADLDPPRAGRCCGRWLRCRRSSPPRTPRCWPGSTPPTRMTLTGTATPPRG